MWLILLQECLVLFLCQKLSLLLSCSFIKFKLDISSCGLCRMDLICLLGCVWVFMLLCDSYAEFFLTRACSIGFCVLYLSSVLCATAAPVFTFLWCICCQTGHVDAMSVIVRECYSNNFMHRLPFFSCRCHNVIVVEILEWEFHRQTAVLVSGWLCQQQWRNSVSSQLQLKFYF